MTTVPFVIATQPRTGSSLLVSLLNSHNQVTCHGELLKDPVGFPSGGFYELLERTVFEADAHAAGFKLFFEHQLPGLPGFLNSRGVRIIHLRRENLLKQYVSLRLALATDLWMTTEPIAPSRKLFVPIETMVSWFEQSVAETTQHNADFAERPAVSLTYEDLVSDQERELRKVWDLLEVPFCLVTSPLQKQETRCLDQIIDNFDEVEMALRGTPWERFLATTSAESPAVVENDSSA